MIWNWLRFSSRKTIFSENDIPDLSGRVFIITGGTSGLGLATAIQLARKNAHVIITARSKEKGDAALKVIQEAMKDHASLPGGLVEYGIMELEDLSSVNAFVDWFLEKDIPLHVLILNAGIAAVPFKLIHGVESQMFVNHLAHMYLTNLLLEKLSEAADPRIVIVSSDAHWMIVDQSVDWHLVLTRQYWNLLDAFRQYGYSKLANLLFQRGLLARLGPETRITVNAVHPGVVATNITQKTIWSSITSLLQLPFATSVEEGALTQVYVATHPDIQQQKISNAFFIPIAKQGDMSRLAKSEEEAERLWTASEEVLGKMLLLACESPQEKGEQPTTN